MLSGLCLCSVCLLRQLDVSYQETLFSIAYKSARLCNCLGSEFIFQSSVLGSLF